MTRHKHKRASAPEALLREKHGAPKKGSILTVVASAAAVGLVIVLFSWPGASQGGLTASADAAHGKALYAKYCASCHGPNGVGEFNWMNRDRAAPPLDSSGHAWHHEDAQLVSSILDKPVPDSRMPAWRGILSRDDAIDLVAYIKTLWTPFIRENCQGAKHMQCTSTH